MRDDLFQRDTKLPTIRQIHKSVKIKIVPNELQMVALGQADRIPSKGERAAVGDAVSRVAYLIAGCPIN